MKTELGKLLVVDDNEMNRDMLSRRLQRLGHTVEIAVDGKQALEMLEKQTFDLILLDIMMPKKTGIAIYKTLREVSSLKRIPVIIVSAFSRTKDFPARNFDELVARAGMPQPAGYIEKPINRNLLITKALEAVGG